MRLELDRKNNWWLEGRIIPTWEISEEYEKLADALEVLSNEILRLTDLLRECEEVVEWASRQPKKSVVIKQKAQLLLLKLAEFKGE